RVREMHALAIIQQGCIVQVVGAAGAEEEVGEVVANITRRHTGGPAERPRILIFAVLRMKVIDLRVNALILVAGLKTVSADKESVVDARIDDGRVLVLRVAALPSQA